MLKSLIRWFSGFLIDKYLSTLDDYEFITEHEQTEKDIAEIVLTHFQGFLLNENR